MRLEIGTTDAGDIILTSPDVPGFRRTARGKDQLWHRLNELQQALRGVQEGTYEPATTDQIDMLLGDAEAALTARVRNQAKRVRATVAQLQAVQREEQERERELIENRRAREEAEREIADAAAALAAARKRAAALGTSKSQKGKKKAGGVFGPKPGIGRAKDPKVTERRKQAAELLDQGMPRSEIAEKLGITYATLHNDIVVLRREASHA